MDLQTRKLNVIEYLISLQDEKLFDKIEATLFKTTPFTKQQLIERAKVSEEDYLSGRFKTQDQLEADSVNW